MSKSSPNKQSLATFLMTQYDDPNEAVAELLETAIAIADHLFRNNDPESEEGTQELQFKRHSPSHQYTLTITKEELED